MERLRIIRRPKNMVFQPQYAKCFTASTSFLSTYNFQSQNLSTTSQIPNNKTVNTSSVSGALFDGSYEFFDLS